MKVLLIGSFRYGIYAPAFAAGFRELGHEVITIDYDSFHLVERNKLAIFLNRLQDRYHYGLKMKAYNKAVLDEVKLNNPDLVFLYRCYHIYSSTLRKIRGKAVLMSYNNDDPFSGVPSKGYYRYHIANSCLCDINFVYRKCNIQDYAKLGVNNTKLLLPYYLSWQNKPIDCKKDIDVLYVGHFEDDGRDYCIKRLIEEGIDVQLYGGNTWKNSRYYNELSSFFHGEAFGDEYNRLLNRARVLLVFFSKHNHDTYTRRCFEIPAIKGVMLSEYTKDMDELYPEDECAAYFRNHVELVQKCKELISNDSEIQRIAQNAFVRLQTLGGSEIDRVKEIIDNYNTIKHG